MKFNPKLRQDIERYKDYAIIVEGKKDIAAMNHLGFYRVYALHKTGVSLREGVEEMVGFFDKKDKVCILTDFDRRGKQLYMKVKEILQELGVRLDSSLRGILIKARVSHIEGFDKFIEKVDNIGR